MAKFSTVKKFYLCSICSVFLFTALGKILFILYRAAASDIMIAGAASFFLRTLCSIVYAVSFFGKKTGGKSFLLSMLCLLSGDALLFLYNITRNVVGSASIKAWALSTLMEILFSGVILGLAFWICCKKISFSKSEKAESIRSSAGCFAFPRHHLYFAYSHFIGK